MSDKCKRCGKDHETRRCRATIQKSWPGKPVMRIVLRHPDGSWQQLDTVLTVPLMKRAVRLFLDAVKQPEAHSDSN